MNASTTDPFDPDGDLTDAPRVGGRQPTKDAATLILTRIRKGATEVLMGRRAPGHVFMASKWVFPGGRIDRSDFTAAAANELPAADMARLTREVPARRARALALAAVRETFEETGLLLAAPAPIASVAGPWREFRAVGALPDLAALSYVARAITPPGRSRRFDARFFMAPAEALLSLDRQPDCGELDEIAWVDFDEAMALDLPNITRFVVSEIGQRLKDAGRPAPFMRFLNGARNLTYV